MCRFFFLVLVGILCFSSKSLSEDIETLMDNVLVLRVRDTDGSKVNVPLSCGEAYQDQPVFWKKNGILKPGLQGNEVSVTVEEWDGGNYTCHLGQDGQYLNHTVIMVQLEPDNRTVILKETSPEEGYIHCSTPNYRGNFHCTWTRDQYRSNAAVLLVKAHRNLEEIPCVLDASGSGIECEDYNCPYKEEQHRISLTVYIHSVSRLEAYTKAFYLREIVTPGKVPDLQFTDGKFFQWDYPRTWDKPCSYFSLVFQVKVVNKGHSCDFNEPIMLNTTTKTEYEPTVQAKRYVFCVRAQDQHTGGPWSHWSHCIVNNNAITC